MKKRRKTARGAADTLAEEEKEEDSVIEESIVLFNFPEFHSTNIFKDATFEPLQDEQAGGTSYKISNCSFDTISFDKLETDDPNCLINGYLPLSGKQVVDGMTYILVDQESLAKSADDRPYDPNPESSVWYTNKCIEFSTD